jgi:hypothetical protein
MDASTADAATGMQMALAQTKDKRVMYDKCTDVKKHWYIGRGVLMHRCTGIQVATVPHAHKWCTDWCVDVKLC